MDLDIAAVRAFVAVVDRAHFGDAALHLGISQQATSKRIGKLESRLGIRLLERGVTGAAPTPVGRTFLNEARNLLAAADRAAASVSPRRPLRVDVLGTRLAPSGLLQQFHEQNPDLDIEVSTSDGLRSAVPALREHRIDAAFARPGPALPQTVRVTPAYLDRLTLAVGRHHDLASRTQITPNDLAGRSVWMPGNAPGSEWADYYDLLARKFALTIDAQGPNFGIEYLLDELARNPARASFLGLRIKVADRPDVVQIPIVEPALVYPHALLWDQRFEHPALPRLRTWFHEVFAASMPEQFWAPEDDDLWMSSSAEKRQE